MKNNFLIVCLLNSVLLVSASDAPRGANYGDAINNFLALLPPVALFGANYEIGYKKTDGYAMDADKREIKREAYIYSAEQRKEARTECEAAALGIILKPLCNWRTEQSFFVALERSLLPAACYTESKKIISWLAPKADNKVITAASLVSGLCMAQCIARFSGASPERLAFVTFLYPYTGYKHNMHRHSNGLLKAVTGSLAYGFKVTPLIQMAVGRWYKEPSMLTLHPVMYRQIGGPNTYGEYMHALVPVGVLAGVDFTFNAVAATPFGAVINSCVDAGINKAIQPLPKHMQRPFRRISRDLKQYSLEAAKIMTTVAILVAMEANGLKFA